jgi:hypothetical protein
MWEFIILAGAYVILISALTSFATRINTLTKENDSFKKR